MVYLHYKECDLFSVPDDYILVHCISADLAMGKGIALQFEKKFGTKTHLVQKYKTRVDRWDNDTVPGPAGECLRDGRVLNLVTKRNYWQKPTLSTLRKALEDMRKICYVAGITKVAMPRIGCGLDRLEWQRVYEQIESVFGLFNIEIMVCDLPISK